MKDTRFIFVEGVMGSGKSTTAWFLTEQFQQQGMTAWFLPEGPTVEQPQHPLRLGNQLPHPKQVWRDVTVEQYIEQSLQKWQLFVEQREHHTDIIVCDGLLFHGNMTDVFLMNAEPAVLQRYVAQVIEMLRSLNPVLIYFYHRNVAHAIRAVCDERGSAWEHYQVTWKVSSPYGAQRGLQGFDGLVQLYQAYRVVCDEIFAQLWLPKLAICNEGQWAHYYQDILTFLQFPPASSTS